MQSARLWRKGWTALAGAGLLLGTGGIAAITTAGVGTAASQLAVHPNHPLGVKPPGGGHNGGGGSASYGWASSNWSGYATTRSTPYTDVTASWTVPTVLATRQASYSAAWTGIDGFTNSSLIQTGTEQDYYQGSAHYAAWWTTSNQGFIEQPIAESVAPGDTMTAHIYETATDTWTIELSDTGPAHDWAFSLPGLSYAGPGASAEWILEAPTVGGRIAPLAHYQGNAFDPDTANDVTPGFAVSDAGIMIQGRSTVSTPSLPDSDTDGFAMAYGSTQPSAPTS
jgi:hypothetical protein